MHAFPFEVVNEQEKEYTGVIRLRKTDIYTGEVLEDAEFTVLQWNRGKQTYQNDLGVQSILKFDIETRMVLYGRAGAHR